MTFSLVSSSVSPDPSVTTYTIGTSNPKNEPPSQAVNIGDLDEESSIVSVSDQGSGGTSAVSTTFTALDGYTSLGEAFGNIVDQITTQFQLFDSSGDVIADSQGTDAQQAAYQEWLAGTLAISPGTYTAVATPDQNENPPASLTIASQEQQGTSLAVNSSLTGSDTSEYYNFGLSGNNIKLAFDAGASNGVHVQLLNSTGGVVADSDGNSFEQSNFIALTSGTGLSASSGDYTVKVSYAPGADVTQNIKYDFQLYSGNSYAVVYKNNISTPAYDNTALGSVTPTSDAKLFTTKGFNQIQTSAQTAVTAGWLQENKSALDIYSQLTSVDSADYYTFVLQQGNNLKLGLNPQTTTNASDLRIQLLNSTGAQVLADNYGTAAQREAYQELTTTNGAEATPGSYIVKVSYAPNAPKLASTYELGIYSGTSYSALYKTTASAQTYANAILSGETSGTSSATAIASYLTAVKNGDTTQNLSTALKSFV